jgi:hypothetical protein
MIFDGPTPERLKQSDGHVAIGDDKRGGRVYTFVDSSLHRIYADLVKKHPGQDDQLKVEYAALRRYYQVYAKAGRLGSFSSMDLDRAGRSSPFGRDFLANTESEVNAREAYREACERLTHQQSIVVQNVVCNDQSLEIAGYAVGKKSKTRANVCAREMLRSAGAKLAALWKMA